MNLNDFDTEELIFEQDDDSLFDDDSEVVQELSTLGKVAIGIGGATAIGGIIALLIKLLKKKPSLQQVKKNDEEILKNIQSRKSSKPISDKEIREIAWSLTKDLNIPVYVYPLGFDSSSSTTSSEVTAEEAAGISKYLITKIPDGYFDKGPNVIIEINPGTLSDLNFDSIETLRNNVSLAVKHEIGHTKTWKKYATNRAEWADYLYKVKMGGQVALSEFGRSDENKTNAIWLYNYYNLPMEKAANDAMGINAKEMVELAVGRGNANYEWENTKLHKFMTTPLDPAILNIMTTGSGQPINAEQTETWVRWEQALYKEYLPDKYASMQGNWDGRLDTMNHLEDIDMVKKESYNELFDSTDFDGDSTTLDRFNRPLSIYQEASQSRKATERRNYNKNLEMMDYDPSTKTISMTDINGQKNRVLTAITGVAPEGVDQYSYDAIKSSIYASFNDNGVIYINIPPRFLKQMPSSKLLPIIRHEIEHVNQMDSYRTKTSTKLNPETPFKQQLNFEYLKNSKEVVEYTSRFIEKHRAELHDHDAAEHELLSDLVAAKKYGPKKLKRALQLTYKMLDKVMRKQSTQKESFGYDQIFDNDYLSALKNISDEDEFKSGQYVSELKDKVVEEISDNLESYESLIIKDFNLKEYIKLLFQAGVDERTIKLFTKTENVKKFITDPIENKNKLIEGFINKARTLLKAIENTPPTREKLIPILEKFSLLEQRHVSELNKYLNQQYAQVKKFLARSTELRIQFCKEALRDQPWNKGIYKESDDLSAYDDSLIKDDDDLGEFNDTDDEDDDTFDFDNDDDDVYDDINDDADTDDDINEDDDELSDFGKYTEGTPNNEFDPSDIEELNNLISDEQEAIKGYFEASKKTNNDLLVRLYSDIGDEERYHTEQLLFAKATLMGEKYTPSDPRVKEEYNELIKNGVDDEEALATAVSMKQMYDTDETEEEVIEEASYIIQSIEDAIAMNDMCLVITEAEHINEIDKQLSVIAESYIMYMEDVEVAKDRVNLFNPLSIIKVLAKGAKSFWALVQKLAQKLAIFINKHRIKSRAKLEWLRKHGLKELFSQGIYLYFYDSQTNMIQDSPVLFVDLMYRTTRQIAKSVGMEQFVPEPNQPITDGLGRSPIQSGSIEQSLKILNNAVLTKEKIALTSKNRDSIITNFFSGGEGSVLATYQRLLQFVNLIAEAVYKFTNQLSQISQTDFTNYQNNRKNFDRAIADLKDIQNGFKKFIKALTNDIDQILKLNNDAMRLLGNQVGNNQNTQKI